MNHPNELKYTKSHEWVETVNDNTVRIGLTDYAQDSLGSIVFADLPNPGEEVEVDEPFADVESVKAVSEVFSPVTGRIAAVNEKLLSAPELINDSPYDAWFIEVTDISEQTEYMDSADYEAFFAAEQND